MSENGRGAGGMTQHQRQSYIVVVHRNPESQVMHGKAELVWRNIRSRSQEDVDPVIKGKGWVLSFIRRRAG